MPPNEARKIVSIIGASKPSATSTEAAENLGRLLVDLGYRIVNGGLGGVMAAASRGARSSTAWTEGSTVAILPGLDAGAANPWSDIVIPTGLSIGRNLLVVSTGDLVVAVGGGSGTLSEIALAWQLGKPVIGLDLGEGWSSRLAGEQIDERRDDVIHRAGSAQEAVQLVDDLLRSD
ncbi:MAG: TIGR00725 family protein [Myxococcota bacterium]|nr:TIGR00725 family protein [Myxococcota bacterium]